MHRFVIRALACLPLAACSHPAPVDPLTDAPPVLANYAEMLFAEYSDAVTGVDDLQGALAPITTGTADQALLESAREAWIASRPAYLQSEAARFYGGPIDDPDTGPEGRINAWPLDEAYVDYVLGAGGVPSYGGLVNDPTLLPEVTEQAIASLNEVGSEENLSLGYHAIEFLLWGQDLSATGSGDRPFTDYVIGDAAGMNQDRRRLYLGAAAVALGEDLVFVRDAWAPGVAENYRAEFVALPPREGVRRIIVGMGRLSGGELAGQRMGVAYNTKDQNDEHSCFSDTTLQDQYHDALGIQNVYLGRYVRTDGTMVSGASLSDLVRARDPALDTRFRAELWASLDAIQAIPGPFDQAILGADSAPGRVAILAAINALHRQTDTISEIARVLGVVVNLED